jgi:hypothetical protein
MPEPLYDIVESLRCSLLDVSAKASAAFSGLGILVYDADSFPAQCHCDLRDTTFLKPDGSCFGGVGNRLTDLLLAVSCESHPCHDGFVFMNVLGNVTHVAQYFVPPVVPHLAPHSLHGTRFYSALCGSLVPGVVAVGVVCRNRDCFLMQSGRVTFQCGRLVHLSEDRSIPPESAHLMPRAGSSR